MALRVATILLLCTACVLAQFPEESGGGGGGVGPILPKKTLHIPARRLKARPASPTSQTTISNQRFRRPIPINKPRPSVEPIPELPVFTSGIRGSRPSAINFEQNDEASAVPIQTIQQPHIVHAQSISQPIPILPDVKPVSEENEKDEDVVQVIANLGQVSGFTGQGNLLTPTVASPILPTSTINSFLQQQRQQERLENQQERQEHQQQRNEQQQERQQLFRDNQQQHRDGQQQHRDGQSQQRPIGALNSYLQQQHQQERQEHQQERHEQQQERQQQYRDSQQQHRDGQSQQRPIGSVNAYIQQQHQQERQEHQQERQEHVQEKQQQYRDRKQQYQDRHLQQQDRRQEDRLQQRENNQQDHMNKGQHFIPIYRPVQQERQHQTQQITRSTPTPVPDAIHQVITPVQYRPQKPIRIQKQQIQQQQLVERNEYDLNEARPLIKQRAQVVPKKSKPQSDYYEGRTRKPVAQVIRRYREETADGSIIWGFENDDGSFKEEIIGIDCITRGKYGYVDPDGLRREYTYETGIKCDEEPIQQQDQDILNTFVDYQENKLVLPSGKTIDLSSMGKKQARRPQPIYRN